MRVSKGWLFELWVIVIADLLVGYLALEAIDAFTGASYQLPITALFVTSLGLSPELAGLAISALLAGFLAVLVVWLARYTPGVLAAFLGSRAKAPHAERPAPPAPKAPSGPLRVEDLKLEEGAQAQPFVDIVQLEGYPLNIYSAVTKQEGQEGYTYVVIEPTLSEAENAQLRDLKKLLVDELDLDLGSLGSPEKAERYVSRKARELVKKYGYKIASPTMTKLLYYLTRDFIHLGKIEPLMRDRLIEDISCDGPGIPLYIWYRDYESIPTNITFETDQELDAFVSKLAYSAGKHVSLAEPIVDASLADGSRLHLTFGKEITQRGSTFTIRKFRTDPLTIVDLIRYNTISSEVAAYLWYLIEKKLALLIAGGTASGKTTSLNALSMFIEPGEKIVSVEDTPEMNIPHENWIQSVTRGVGTASEISMFDLLKASLRQRPDVLIVGEIRGEEAFTLMQSISSVTGDTPILVRENGSTSLRPIAEIVDKYYRADAERVPVAVEGPDVLSFDNRGVVQFQPVRYVLRHKASEIYGVRYTGGRVRATGSHSVFVFDEDCKVVPRPVSMLKKDDIMVSFVGSSIDRAQAQIDVKSALSGAAGHDIVESRRKANCPRCGVAETKKAGRVSGKQRFWCYRCARTFMESLALTYVDELASQHGGGLVAFTKSSPLSPRLTVDKLFARVLGIYVADGCVKHHRNSARVVFTLGTPEKRLFVGDLIEFFGIHGSAPSVDDRGTYAIYEFNHSVLAELIESLCGRELTEKRVPDFIWTSPSEVVDSFISGWTADARRTGNPNWTSTSSVRPDLVASLSWLARINGRPTFISERSSKYPCVMISTRAVQPLKSSQTIPAKPLLRLAKLLGSTARRHIPMRTARVMSKRRARLALEEILARKRLPVTWEASELVATIKALLDGRLVAAPIRTVERLPFEGFVYDLSVPGTEAFFGGDSPVALHNTGHGGLGTIHADSVEAVINRLTTEPMNIPRSLVGTTLDCIVMQLKMRLADRSVRRVVGVTEVVGYDARSDEILLNDAFKWDPVIDTFSFTGRSKLFDKITTRYGTRPDEIRRDIDGRKVFLDWLAAKNIRSHVEVSEHVREFYAGPYAVINKAKVELEGLKA